MKLSHYSAILGLGSTLLAAAAQPPTPPPTPAIAPSNTQTITTHSRIRGFSAGPDGAPRTLFLSNGDAIELGPRFGIPAANLGKGERIEVTGTSTKTGNQRTIDASTMRVGTQTYVAATAANAVPPPPADGGPGAPPPAAPTVAMAPPPPPAGAGPRSVPAPLPCGVQPDRAGVVSPVPPPPPAPAADAQTLLPPAQGAGVFLPLPQPQP